MDELYNKLKKAGLNNVNDYTSLLEFASLIYPVPEDHVREALINLKYLNITHLQSYYFSETLISLSLQHGKPLQEVVAAVEEALQRFLGGRRKNVPEIPDSESSGDNDDDQTELPLKIYDIWEDVEDVKSIEKVTVRNYLMDNITIESNDVDKIKKNQSQVLMNKNEGISTFIDTEYVKADQIKISSVCVVISNANDRSEFTGLKTNEKVSKINLKDGLEGSKVNIHNHEVQTKDIKSQLDKKAGPSFPDIGLYHKPYTKLLDLTKQDINEPFSFAHDSAYRFLDSEPKIRKLERIVIKNENDEENIKKSNDGLGNEQNVCLSKESKENNVKDMNSECPMPTVKSKGLFITLTNENDTPTEPSTNSEKFPAKSNEPNVDINANSNTIGINIMYLEPNVKSNDLFLNLTESIVKPKYQFRFMSLESSEMPKEQILNPIECNKECITLNASEQTDGDQKFWGQNIVLKELNKKSIQTNNNMPKEPNKMLKQSPVLPSAKSVERKLSLNFSSIGRKLNQPSIGVQSSRPNVKLKELNAENQNIKTNRQRCKPKEPHVPTKEPNVGSIKLNVILKESDSMRKELNMKSLRQNVMSLESNIMTSGSNFNSLQPNSESKEPNINSIESNITSIELITKLKELNVKVVKANVQSKIRNVKAKEPKVNSIDPNVEVVDSDILLNEGGCKSVPSRFIRFIDSNVNLIDKGVAEELDRHTDTLKPKSRISDMASIDWFLHQSADCKISSMQTPPTIPCTAQSSVDQNPLPFKPIPYNAEFLPPNVLTPKSFNFTSMFNFVAQSSLVSPKISLLHVPPKISKSPKSTKLSQYVKLIPKSSNSSPDSSQIILRAKSASGNIAVSKSRQPKSKHKLPNKILPKSSLEVPRLMLKSKFNFNQTPKQTQTHFESLTETSCHVLARAFRQTQNQTQTCNQAQSYNQKLNTHYTITNKSFTDNHGPKSLSETSKLLKDITQLAPAPKSQLCPRLCCDREREAPVKCVSRFRPRGIKLAFKKNLCKNLYQYVEKQLQEKNAAVLKNQGADNTAHLEIENQDKSSKDECKEVERSAEKTENAYELEELNDESIIESIPLSDSPTQTENVEGAKSQEKTIRVMPNTAARIVEVASITNIARDSYVAGIAKVARAANAKVTVDITCATDVASAVDKPGVDVVGAVDATDFANVAGTFEVPIVPDVAPFDKVAGVVHMATEDYIDYAANCDCAIHAERLNDLPDAKWKLMVETAAQADVVVRSDVETQVEVNKHIDNIHSTGVSFGTETIPQVNGIEHNDYTTQTEVNVQGKSTEMTRKTFKVESASQVAIAVNCDGSTQVELIKLGILSGNTVTILGTDEKATVEIASQSDNLSQGRKVEKESETYKTEQVDSTAQAGFWGHWLLFGWGQSEAGTGNTTASRTDTATQSYISKLTESWTQWLPFGWSQIDDNPQIETLKQPKRNIQVGAPREDMRQKYLEKPQTGIRLDKLTAGTNTIHISIRSQQQDERKWDQILQNETLEKAQTKAGVDKSTKDIGIQRDDKTSTQTDSVTQDSSTKQTENWTQWLPFGWGQISDNQQMETLKNNERETQVDGAKNADNTKQCQSGVNRSAAVKVKMKQGKNLEQTKQTSIKTKMQISSFNPRQDKKQDIMMKQAQPVTHMKQTQKSSRIQRPVDKKQKQILHADNEKPVDNYIKTSKSLQKGDKKTTKKTSSWTQWLPFGWGQTGDSQQVEIPKQSNGKIKVDGAAQAESVKHSQPLVSSSKDHSRHTKAEMKRDQSKVRDENTKQIESVKRSDKPTKSSDTTSILIRHQRQDDNKREQNLKPTKSKIQVDETTKWDDGTLVMTRRREVDKKHVQISHNEPLDKPQLVTNVGKQTIRDDISSSLQQVETTKSDNASQSYMTKETRWGQWLPFGWGPISDNQSIEKVTQNKSETKIDEAQAASAERLHSLMAKTNQDLERTGKMQQIKLGTKVDKLTKNGSTTFILPHNQPQVEKIEDETPKDEQSTAHFSKTRTDKKQNANRLLRPVDKNQYQNSEVDVSAKEQTDIHVDKPTYSHDKANTSIGSVQFDIEPKQNQLDETLVRHQTEIQADELTDSDSVQSLVESRADKTMGLLNLGKDDMAETESAETREQKQRELHKQHAEEIEKSLRMKTMQQTDDMALPRLMITPDRSALFERLSKPKMNNQSKRATRNKCLHECSKPALFKKTSSIKSGSIIKHSKGKNKNKIPVKTTTTQMLRDAATKKYLNNNEKKSKSYSKTPRDTVIFIRK